MNEVSWLSHSVLLREAIFSGYILNTEPIRIGSGREPPLGAPVDLAVLRIEYNGAEIPYIPGSSLKGVFRNYATLLAKYSGLSVCTGLSKETCGETKTIGDKKLDKYIDDKMKSGESAEAMRVFSENACLMCKIFGSARYLSNVFFSDAYPVDNYGKIVDVKTGVRPGIAVDRRTGAVHTFYRVEYVEPGAKFWLVIRCRNLPNYAIGLLSLVLKRIYEGQIKVGGFKSRGFGAVKIEGLKFRIRDFVKELSLLIMPLEPKIDSAVDLSGISKLEDSWIVSEGEEAWKALEMFIEVWNRFARKN